MKHLLYLFLLLFLSFEGLAQYQMPQFERPVAPENLNSKAEESMPLLSNNGNTMYFIKTVFKGSLKERSKGQEVYFSNRVNGEWEKASSLFDEINDDGNNAVIGTSPDGKTVYLFNSIQSHKKLAQGICYTKQDENGEWSPLKKIDIPGFEVGEGYYSFFLDPTEHILLISMSPSEGILEEDLFVSLKDTSGNWSAVKNLGDSINTSSVESTPFIANDLKSLYFSSNGHGGWGGSDIFVSYRLDDTWQNWSKPRNLGAPINSPDYDAFFVIGENEEAYFTSNRDSEFSDIFYTRITQSFARLEPKESQVIKATFQNENKAVKDVKLKIYDADGNFIKEVITDENGNFEYTKLSSDDNYVIRVADAEDDTEILDGKIYFVDDRGEKKERLTTLADGSFRKGPEVEIVKGAIESKGTAAQGIKVNLYDQKGNFIKQVITDDHGEFEYSKLDAQENYVIKLDDEDLTSFPDAEVFVLDPSTNTKVPINSRGMVALNTSKTTVAPKEIKGKLNLKEELKEGVKLDIYDESGNFIKQVETDSHGDFTYTKLNPEENYFIKIAAKDSDEIIEGDILLLDISTGEEKSLNLAEDGTAAENDSVAAPVMKEPIKGQLKQKDLELAYTKIVVYDENNFALDTIVTDKNGNFVYRKLDMDERVILRPLLAEEGQLAEFDVNWANEIDTIPVGDAIVPITEDIARIEETDTIAASTIDEVAENNEVKDNYVDPKPVVQKVNTDIAESLTDTLLFEFNEYTISDEKKKQIQMIANQLLRDKSKTITITGHTDYIGVQSNNLKVSRWRALAVKDVLISMGIDATRIKALWKGELEPVADNHTLAGRRKNRRVELLIQ